MNAAPSSTETVVVGGGIAGVALAYHLASGGAPDVVVLEQAELASGATGFSLGGVRQQFSTPLEIELSKRGLEFWRSVEDRFDSPCPFHRDGYLFLTARAALGDRMAEAARLQRELGAGPVELLGPEGIAERFPWIDPVGLVLVAGCWTPEDGRVNPPDGVTALARAGRRLGVRYVEGFPVKQIRHEEGGFVVSGPEDVRAQRVVVAAGIWSPALCRPLGYDPQIRPMQLHYALTELALGGEDVPLTIDFETGLCVHREGQGLSIVLAEDVPAEYGPYDMIEEFATAAAIRAPALADLRIRRVVSALADLSADGHPYVGEFDDGLWIIAGFGGHGTMHGAPIAELLAGRILGRSALDLDLSLLDPHRPVGDVDKWMVATRKP